MQVRAFKGTDLNSVNKYLFRRGMSAVTASELPSRMYVVPGVAAAGIRAVEGNLWLMDSLVTNSLCSASVRNEALNSLYAYITKTYTGIIGFSVDEGAITRAKCAGFQELPVTVLRYNHSL